MSSIDIKYIGASCLWCCRMDGDSAIVVFSSQKMADGFCMYFLPDLILIFKNRRGLLALHASIFFSVHRGADLEMQIAGVAVTVIDFTLSRLTTALGEVASLNLDDDPSIFDGPKGDCQVSRNS